MSTDQTTPAGQVVSRAEEPSSFFSQRSRRQLGLFFAGASFFAISTLITRRSLVKRYKATIPKFYQQSNQPNEVNGAMDAFEALNIATVNVASVSVMIAGGLLWALDISSLDDMRRRARGAIELNGSGGSNDADEEMEEWLATVLARKDFKEMVRKAAKDKKDKKEE